MKLKSITERLTSPINKHRWKPYKERAQELRTKIQNQRTIILNYFGDDLSTDSKGQHYLSSYHNAFDDVIYSLFDRMNNELGELGKILNKGHKDKLTDFLNILTGTDYTKRRLDSLTSYAAIFKYFSEKYETKEIEMIGTPFQDSVLEQLVQTENPFIEGASKMEFDKIGNSVIEDFRTYAKGLHQIYSFDIEKDMEQYITLLKSIKTGVIQGNKDNSMNEYLIRNLPSLNGFKPKGIDKTKNKAVSQIRDYELQNKFTDIKKNIALSLDWSNAPEMVADFYKDIHLLKSSGLLNIAMIQTVSGVEFKLVPKTIRKKISFDELIGYEKEKAAIINNTEKLLKGEDSNNIFMYGPPGTGKSSMINALLTQYQNQNLKVIEIQKETIPILPQIYDNIESRHDYKFIIVVDEFRVGENKAFYDSLKSVIEGSFEGIPNNARMYIISNNENSTKLGFKNKEDADEALALDDRFGLKIQFHLPEEAEQKQIMEAYLQKQKSDKTPDQVWDKYKSYCIDSKIERPNPRNIRDFVKTI